MTKENYRFQFQVQNGTKKMQNSFSKENLMGHCKPTRRNKDRKKDRQTERKKEKRKKDRKKQRCKIFVLKKT
jgi:hypothetical protein